MCESHVLITRWPTDPSAIAEVHGSAKKQVDEVRVAVVERSEPTTSPISGGSLARPHRHQVKEFYRDSIAMPCGLVLPTARAKATFAARR